MALVGGLVFCTACGNLLDRRQPDEKEIACNDCGTPNQSRLHRPLHSGPLLKPVSFPDRWPLVITSQTKPSAFPSALQRKRDSKVQQLSEEDMEAAQSWPITQQVCPECGNPEMRFKTLQTRSADEGSTVYYQCPNCDHR